MLRVGDGMGCEKRACFFAAIRGLGREPREPREPRAAHLCCHIACRCVYFLCLTARHLKTSRMIASAPFYHCRRRAYRCLFFYQDHAIEEGG